MMLIICDKNPYIATNYLYHHTNKNFAFKQLLELAQLVCSCGCSKVYKPIKQGKELQEWIKQNKEWIFVYFSCLFGWAKWNINISAKTIKSFDRILSDLYFACDKPYWEDVRTAVFRYKQEYVCDYITNSELPIETACNEYKKYLDWKFKSNG